MAGKRGITLKIGVLALQGAVAEHIRMLEKASTRVEAVAIKKASQLEDIDGLVIPGGESTTIGKLIRKYELFEPLLQKIKQGFPVFGTCAGLIVLAAKIVGQDTAHLGVLDMLVQRNAFGRQRESFETTLSITGVADDFHAVFIRAPLVLEVGESVQVLAMHQEQIVAVQEGHLLATSFHPELTNDARLHAYFIEMVEQYVTGSSSVML